MAVLIDREGLCRILCAYFDGRLRVQYTRCLSFIEFVVEPLPRKDYVETIDLQKYYDLMDKLLKWAWPITQGDTSQNKLRPAVDEPQAKGEDQPRLLPLWHFADCIFSWFSKVADCLLQSRS